MRDILYIVLFIAAFFVVTRGCRGDTIQIAPQGIYNSYIDGNPENRDGPYPTIVLTDSAGYTYTTGVGTPDHRLYGMEQLDPISAKVGDMLSVTIKSSSCQSLDGTPALGRLVLASDWNDNYYISNTNVSINLTESINNWTTYSIVLDPANFTVRPVGDTGIGFVNTIDNAQVFGVDFMSAGNPLNGGGYVGNQLPSYGIVGNVSIGQVSVPEPSSLSLLVAAVIVGIVFGGVILTRKKCV